MSKQDAIFIGVGIYSFGAVAILWALGMRNSFGGFCLIAVLGLPLPFIIDRVWEHLQ